LFILAHISQIAFTSLLIIIIMIVLPGWH